MTLYREVLERVIVTLPGNIVVLGSTTTTRLRFGVSMLVAIRSGLSSKSIENHGDERHS